MTAPFRTQLGVLTERYGDRLLEVYRQLAESTASAPTAASGDALLDAFLAPERLFLLKT